MSQWTDIIITPTTSILTTIQVIDQSGLRAAIVTDADQRLLGMVTDGDIRRAILRQVNLNDPVSTIMNNAPIIATANETREQILAKMQAMSIHHVPIINDAHRLIGFETLEKLLAITHHETLVVVMAGGLGKRLHPLTVDCPKPLIKIGTKPVLEILLENFLSNGFKHFCFIVNYKADMIRAYFADGARWQAHIEYVEENQQLGTAGGLGLLKRLPQEAFFVINADVVTNINFKCLLEYHQESKVDATMCIREHEQVVPYGVVERDDATQHLISIIEKPKRQYYVNAGIYILEPSILNYLTPESYCDMPDLLMNCVQHHRRVATFPIREYWLDIGRHEDLEKAHHFYKKAL